MSPAGGQRARTALVLLVTGALSALGVVSLSRQISFTRVDAGFEVVDGTGRIGVAPGGVAERAGLLPRDRLVSIADFPFRGPFDWDRPLRREPPPRIVAVDVARGTEILRFQVPVAHKRGSGTVYVYLALVGFFFLATATMATLRASSHPLTWNYYAFSASVFALFALSDTPMGAAWDWPLFLADRLGRLSFAPLFLLLARSLARPDRRGRWRSALVCWIPPSLFGLAGLAFYLASRLGVLRDPVGLWNLKDQGELLLAFVYLIAGLAVLARAARRENLPQRRYVLRWAFWGSALGLVPLALLYLLPVGLGARTPAWAELSTLTLAVVPLTLSGILFRLRPGDIEIYLKRAIGALSVLFLTLAVFAGVAVLLDRLPGSSLRLSDWTRWGLAFVAAIVLYPWIRGFTHQAIDRLVYGGRFSFRRTLLSFGRELNAELDLQTLVAKFEQRIHETLDLSAALILVRRDREGLLRPVGDSSGPSVPIDSPLMERIHGVSYLMVEDLLQAPGAGRLDALRAQGLQYLFPMKVEGEVRAVLATGPRRGGEPLNSEDVELLVALCGHAAIALESARLFAALQEKVEEVERLRRYSDDILESSRVGILVVDGAGVIQAMNQALVDIYGAKREEAIGRTLGEVFPLPLVRRLVKQDEAPGESAGPRKLYRYSLTDLEGRRIVVNVSVSQLASGEAGRVGGHVITLDEVTDQVRMEEQLQRQERLASIGLLAAGVAHEVNTPLTGISSYAQMLLAEIDPTDPRFEVLKKIERQTFRAASIVHSLLNFTRDGPGVIERIPVSELVGECLALFEPQLRGRRIVVDALIDEGLPLLPGNRSKLQQVFLNLLLNARDAIHESGRIRLRVRAGADRVSIEIADDGEGIAEENMRKIFDPFFTTKPRGSGTGLGLALSYTIVQEHKGEITVESRPGEGAVFTVSLPHEGRDAIHA